MCTECDTAEEGLAFAGLALAVLDVAMKIAAPAITVDTTRLIRMVPRSVIGSLGVMS